MENFNTKSIKMQNERYIVKPEDIKGDIAGFPIEVVQRMVDESASQSWHEGVEVFQLDKTNGFSWGDSREGAGFWVDVIGNKNFDLFFERYPKTSDVPFVIPENTGTPVFRPLENGDLPQGVADKGDKGDDWINTHKKNLFEVLERMGSKGVQGMYSEKSIQASYEQRLYETAKVAMQGLLVNYNSDSHDAEDIAFIAITQAKELLRQLGEETKNPFEE